MAREIVVEKATIGIAVGSKVEMVKQLFWELTVGVGFSPDHFWQKITRMNNEVEFSNVPPDYFFGDLNKLGGFFQLGIGYRLTED